MSKPLYIGTSPLTGTIFVGNVLKDGKTWAANKQDLTGMACHAVAEHVLKHCDGCTELYVNGIAVYEITVKRLIP